MDPILLPLPPNEPGYVVAELHVWIGLWRDGSESILSADLALPGGLGTRHMPLMSSKRDVAADLVRVAERVRKESGGKLARVALRSFRAVGDAS